MMFDWLMATLLVSVLLLYGKILSSGSIFGCCFVLLMLRSVMGFDNRPPQYVLNGSCAIATSHQF